MHLFLFVGIAVSLALTEITGFSPGGIVIAGYLAMFIIHPQWILGTLVAALLTYGIVEFVKSHTLLYGRRAFAVYLLTGILVAQIGAWLFMRTSLYEWGILVIGYLIPGLIARDFSRQGVGMTVLWLTIAVVFTQLIVMTGEGWLWG